MLNSFEKDPKEMSAGPKIDEINAKILKALLKEPRTSFTEIAKECGLSNTSIKNRFDRMKKSGIINGAIMQINPRSFGYDCIAFANIEVDPREKVRVYEFLKKQQFAIYPAQLTGRNVILGFVVSKNTDDLSRIVKQIQSHPNIRSVSTAIWIDITNMDHPENLIVEATDTMPNPNMVQSKEKVSHAITPKQTDIDLEAKGKKINKARQLDKIDIALIKLLSKDARLSFRSIAKKLGISPNNVIKRYKELRKNVLPFSSITVNLQNLGYMGTGVMLINVSSKHSVDQTFDRLLRIPNVIVTIKLFDYYDILAIAPFRVLEDLHDLKEEISNISGVNEINLMVDKPYKKWPLNMISELIIKNL
ncbi:MAG: Lrp/AsnC family transcriptional regulator [Candidatus Bathyarchaeum sp.]|nr:MAG: Lrp/AsnC family transcriptional regulator [Candidatus Bathyarchaeum sp.]